VDKWLGTPVSQSWKTAGTPFVIHSSPLATIIVQEEGFEKMLERPRQFGNLMTQVIRTESCSFCGACIASCPLNILWPAKEKPTMIGTCILCEICYYQCPNIEFSRDDVESFVYGRTRRPDEAIGIFKEAFVGRATRTDIQSKAQDGGIVTALLAYALDKQLIDAAVVAGRDSKWIAQPAVVTKSSDLVKYAGTKYTPSPTLIGVRSAIDDYAKSKVGMVGTPCQIKAARRIQTSPMGNRRLAQAVKLTIGLFCMESYGYDRLVNYLAAKGIDTSNVTKVGIKRGSFIAWSEDKEVLHVPLKEIDGFVRTSCKECDDFTAEFADISVGAIGSADGNSTIIARTEKGLQLLKDAAKAGYVEVRELKPDGKTYQKVANMAQSKRARSAVKG
jgi:coenzyme F420 hydrogenase subunit beta